jgi:hypothetical protein
VDLNGDGLLDLVVGREQGGVSAYRNVGSRIEPRFGSPEPFDLPLPPMSAPVFADLNGDGLLDLLSGTIGGGVAWFGGARR